MVDTRDFGTACSDFVLYLTSYICSQLVYQYSSHSSHVQSHGHSSHVHSHSYSIWQSGHFTILIEFEPAVKSLFYVQYAALIGVIRFGLIPRGQLIVLGHNLMTVLGQQLSISLLGLSYFLLAFPSLSICKYFVSNFNEIFTSFERTLLIIIILAHLLNIQYIDKAIPFIFGILPIVVTIVIAQNFNIFVCGLLSLSSMTLAIYLLHQHNYRRSKLLNIRYVHWFHLLTSLSIFCHTLTLINLANNGILTLWECLTLNFASIQPS
mmetsp:Transcript_15890/g.25200  ORF Transcript_15890/g.25200 Transcript_15890/m.25200 type:complete len:265 (+) Transcript_15890:36-830(+)